MKKFLAVLLLGLSFCANACHDVPIYLVDSSLSHLNSGVGITLNKIPTRIPYKVYCRIFKRMPLVNNEGSMNLKITLAGAPYLNSDIDFEVYQRDSKNPAANVTKSDDGKTIYISSVKNAMLEIVMKNVIKSSDLSPYVPPQNHLVLTNVSDDDMFFACHGEE